MNRYLLECVEQGVRPHAVIRHMMGLYAGEAGGKRWRRFLSEQVQKPDAGGDLLLRSLEVFA
jgi:tRNA-dihydrouridine synthase A